MDERSGLCVTNPMGTGGVLDVCGCGGVGSVGGEWVGGLEHGLEEWSGVLSFLEEDLLKSTKNLKIMQWISFCFNTTG